MNDHFHHLRQKEDKLPLSQRGNPDRPDIASPTRGCSDRYIGEFLRASFIFAQALHLLNFSSDRRGSLGIMKVKAALLPTLSKASTHDQPTFLGYFKAAVEKDRIYEYTPRHPLVRSMHPWSPEVARETSHRIVGYT
jgi:hypothetical protein